MDVNRVKELLPIFHAFSEGREIEYKVNNASGWQKATELVCLDTYIYRIKPEPKYRPFRTQEECWDEMHKHPDLGCVKDIKSGECLQIVCVTDEGVYCFKHSVSSHLFKSLVQEFNFADGTPFGIKEE